MGAWKNVVMDFFYEVGKVDRRKNCGADLDTKQVVLVSFSKIFLYVEHKDYICVVVKCFRNGAPIFQKGSTLKLQCCRKIDANYM